MCSELCNINAVMLRSEGNENMNDSTTGETPSTSVIPAVTTMPVPTSITAVPPITLAPTMPRQAENDDMLIALWLHGRSPATQQAYTFDTQRLLTFVNKPLAQITLADLQAFADDLEQDGLAPASRHRTLAAVKSLFSFAVRLGYLRFDTGKPLRLPKLRNQLAERILDEGQVQRMIAFQPNPRDRAIVLLTYAAGLRVSEVCGLKWRDLQSRGDTGGQVTVHGKGGKTRTILLPQTAWNAIVSLREAISDGEASSNGEAANDDAPVFRSRKGGHLSRVQVMRVVRRAAQRATVRRRVSPHWLRHAHASHSLDRNAPIHVVQQTLGHASLASTSRYVHARPADSSSHYLPL